MADDGACQPAAYWLRTVEIRARGSLKPAQQALRALLRERTAARPTPTPFSSASGMHGRSARPDRQGAKKAATRYFDSVESAIL